MKSILGLVWSLIASMLIVVGAGNAQTVRKPYDKDVLLKVVKLNALPTQEIVAAIEQRGVNFEVTVAVETEFREAGARPELIDAIRRNARRAYAKDWLLNVVRMNTLDTKDLIPYIQQRGVSFEITTGVEAEFRRAGARPELIDAMRSNYRPSAASGVVAQEVVTQEKESQPSLADPSRAEDEIKPLVVRIKAQFADGDSLGTGIIFGKGNDRTYIMTANHVVRRGPQAAQSVRVEFKWLPGEQFEANLLENYDPGLDLGLVAVVKMVIPPGILRFDRLANVSSLKLRDSVYLLGHPEGRSWDVSLTPDKVSESFRDFILFQSLRVRPGHSGGALLNERRDIVGMITESGADYAKAVALSSILEMLTRWGYPVDLKPPGKVSGYSTKPPQLSQYGH